MAMAAGMVMANTATMAVVGITTMVTAVGIHRDGVPATTTVVDTTVRGSVSVSAGLFTIMIGTMAAAVIAVAVMVMAMVVEFTMDIVMEGIVDKLNPRHPAMP